MQVELNIDLRFNAWKLYNMNQLTILTFIERAKYSEREFASLNQILLLFLPKTLENKF